MWWPFWKKRNNVGDPLERISRQVTRCFDKSVETIQRIRFGLTPVAMQPSLVRVFDPRLIVGDELIIRKYGDLDDQQSGV